MVVDDVRVRGTGRSGLRLEVAPKAQTGPPRVDKVGGPVCWSAYIRGLQAQVRWGGHTC